MRLRYPTILLVSCSLFMATLIADSQSKSASVSAANANLHSGPTNLKVLPRDTSLGDVNKLMLRYASNLGVTCTHCHEQNEETQQMDFASDGNPTKATARFMIVMTNDINNKYLVQLGDRRYAQPITCGSCHQGQTMPPTFEK
jgi:hypothetical protein